MTSVEPVEPTTELDLPPVVSPIVRFGGRVVDGVVILAISVPAMAFGFADQLWWQGLLVGVQAAHEVVGVSRWGRTIGKFVVGSKVVDGATGGLPGRRSSVIRWIVPSVLSLVALAIGGSTATQVVGSYGSMIWAVVVYMGIFRRPWRQGLHDRAAGTVVVAGR